MFGVGHFLPVMNRESVFEKLFALGNSYWLTRFIILRLLGFVYAVAFLVAAQQLVPLIGEHGLTPANHFLASVQTQLGSRTAGILRVPTLFWLGISDHGMLIFAWVGFALALVVLGGYANAIILSILWVMYMSIVHIGQIWYGYGWEIQLLETGFLSIFLCPLLDGQPFPKCRPPILVFWLFRWLGFFFRFNERSISRASLGVGTSFFATISSVSPSRFVIAAWPRKCCLNRASRSTAEPM